MHADDDGAAFHELPRRDGAVDAAGHEADNLAGRTHRKSPYPPVATREDVGATLDDLDVDLDVRILHLDLLVGGKRA